MQIERFPVTRSMQAHIDRTTRDRMRMARDRERTTP
jgi:hypothetical protein